MSVDKEQILAGIEEAAERMGLEREDLLEMIPDVIEDCLEKVQTLRSAVDEGDADRVSAIGHDIKGSTINYGLADPSAIAKEIEVGKLDAADRIDALEEVLLQIKEMDISS